MRSRARLSSHPIHPIAVSFPLGLWVAGFLFDLFGRWSGNSLLWAAGYYAIIGGCIGAVLAAAAGAVDLFSVVPPGSSARQRGYIHALVNTAALLLFIVIAWRRGGGGNSPDNLSLLLSLIGVVSIGFSGWLGGTLVYRNQIGVDRRYANAGQLLERTLEDWGRPVVHKSELGDGQMMLARIEDHRVVVARCAESPAAFSDRCTHKGGPLSDGALVGCIVQCPWHGSQFDVTSGRVVAGPAKKKIQTYQTEVRNGEIFVKEPPGEIE